MKHTSLFLYFILMMTPSLEGMRTSENTLYTTMIRLVHEQQLMTCPDYTPESLALINHGINPYATTIHDLPTFFEQRSQLYPDLDFTSLHKFTRQLFSKALKSKEYPECGLPTHVIHDIKRQGATRTYNHLKHVDFKRICEYLDYETTYDELHARAEEVWNSYTLPLQLAFLALLEKRYKRSTAPFVMMATILQLYGAAAFIQLQPLHMLTPQATFFLLLLEKILCVVAASYLFTPTTAWKNMRDMVHVWLILTTPITHVEEFQKHLLGQRAQRDRFLANLIEHFKKKLRDAYE